MKTVAEIRRENLEILALEFGTVDAVAEKAATSPVYLSQIKNRAVDSKTGRPREMGTKVARKLEKGCGKQPGWMDTDPGAVKEAEKAATFLDAWAEVASPRSREVIDQLRMLAQKNTLGDEDWELISQLAMRFQSKAKK